MDVIYPFLVDFARPQRTNELLVMEDDHLSRVCRFILMNNGKKMDVSEVDAVSVNAVLPDDSTIVAEAELSVDDDDNPINEVIFRVPSSMTSAVGKTVCTISLLDMDTGNVGRRISSFEFYINTRNELNSNEEDDDDEMAGLRDLLERAAEAIEIVEQLAAQTALPNPYPLRVLNLGESTINYNGSVLVELDFGDVISRVAALEEAFPAGCRIIAQAITDNGVSTAYNDSPSTFATNIGLIRSDGDAAAGEILYGKKAWVNKSLLTGTMPNRGKVTVTLDCSESYTITDGYHDGTGTVTANSLASQTGVDDGYSAVAATNMQEGYQGWALGEKITGSMPELTSSNFSGAHSSNTAGASSNYVVTSTARGYVPNGTSVHSAAAGTNATAIDTTADTGVQTINIVPGIYNKIKVDQTNAYNAGFAAGETNGKLSAMCAVSPAGSTQTVTRTLPAGTYYYRWVAADYNNTSPYSGTAKITYGSTSLTFNKGSTGTSIANTNAKTGNGSFTLTGDTSVTLQATGPNNPDMGWAMICIYT